MIAQFIHLIRIMTPYILGAAFVLTYIAEHVYPERKEFTDRRHDLKNLLIGVGNLLLAFGVGYFFQQLISFCDARQWGLFQRLHLPFVPGLIIGFVMIDLFMYWWHRLNHEISFFWFFHKFHHQDKQMNSTTAVRFHTGELVLSYAVRVLIFPLLGISLAPILLHAFILFPVIVFHHSNIKISITMDRLLRHFIVTPQMHRVHHSVIKYDTDSNYSSILPFWDQLFKTYHKKTAEPIEFGI